MVCAFEIEFGPSKDTILGTRKSDHRNNEEYVFDNDWAKLTGQLSCSQCPDIFRGFSTSFQDLGSVSTVIAPLLQEAQRTRSFPTWIPSQTVQYT